MPGITETMELLSANFLTPDFSIQSYSFIVATILLSTWYLQGQWRKKPCFPPRGPAGVVKTVKNMSGCNAPWFLLDSAAAASSFVFRLALPIPGVPMAIAVGDGTLARSILQDPSTTKPRFVYAAIEHITKGPNMATKGKEECMHSRKAVSVAFSPVHLKRMDSVVSEKTDEWIQATLGTEASTATIDVGKEMIFLSLAILCEASFEYTMDDSEKELFTSELKLAMTEFAFRSASNPLRLLFGWLLPDRRRAWVAADKLSEIAKRIASNYKSRKTPTKGTVLDLIMTSSAYQSEVERISEIVVFLLAGHDTTGYALAFVLIDLARNPEVQNKLRAKLQQNQTALLQQVIKESMRRMPTPSVGPVRCLGRDFSWNESILPKGCVVFIPPILLGRNPDHYESPEEFKPCRWDNDGASVGFLPFAFGQRKCIGQSLAMAELQSVVALLVQKFEFTLLDEGTLDFFGTLKPVNSRIRLNRLE